MYSTDHLMLGDNFGKNVGTRNGWGIHYKIRGKIAEHCSKRFWAVPCSSYHAIHIPSLTYPLWFALNHMHFIGVSQNVTTSLSEKCSILVEKQCSEAKWSRIWSRRRPTGRPLCAVPIHCRRKCRHSVRRRPHPPQSSSWAVGNSWTWKREIAHADRELGQEIRRSEGRKERTLLKRTNTANGFPLLPGAAAGCSMTRSISIFPG